MAVAAETPADGEHEGEFDDPIRPITSYDLRYKYENDANDSSTTRNDKHTITLRRNVRWDFTPHWRFYVRGDLPLVFANATSSANPNGDYAFGLGRPLLQAYIINSVNDRWGWALGQEFIFPAGSGTQFGNRNWDMMPLFAFRYMLPEISKGTFIAPQFGYAFNYAQGAVGRNTAYFQFAPELKIRLPDNWYFDLYPSSDIRINFGDPVKGQTGRLFLPFDFAVGRNITKKVVVGLEISLPIIDEYPLYRYKTQARLTVTF